MLDRRKWSRLALVAVVLAALTLRLTGLEWDGLYHIHPDERYIVWVGTTVELPTDWHTALDPEQSTFNPFRWPPDADSEGIQVEQAQPRSFAYGHWPLYLGVIAAHLLDNLGGPDGGWAANLPDALRPLRDLLNGPDRIEYHHLAIVGRALAALFDTLTVMIVFALGRRLYGESAGLLAAAMVSLAVLHIQSAHFFITDPFLATAAAAALYWMVRRAESGLARNTLLAGLFAGLAVGAKFSAILLAIPLTIAVVWRRVPQPTMQAAPAGRLAVLLRRFRRPVAELAGAALVAFAVFAITNPFALLDQTCSARLGGWTVPLLRVNLPAITVHSCYLENIGTQGAMVRGSTRIPFTFQYIGTAPYLYYLDQLVRWGLGPTWSLVGFGGLVWGVSRVVRRRPRPQDVVLLAWSLPFFLVTGSFQVKFLRYLLPLTPHLAVLGAGMLATNSGAFIASPAGRQRLPGQLWNYWRLAAVAVVLAGSALWAIAFVSMYRVSDHPWVMASRWIYEHVPAGSALATEHWDHQLPLDLRAEDWARPTPRYRRAELAWFNVEDRLIEEEDRVTLETALGQVAGSDYLVLASNRLYSVIPRLVDRYPEAAAYYRLLFEGRLGFDLAYWAGRYPTLGSLILLDDTFSRPGLTVPRVLAEWASAPSDWNLGPADESFTVYDHPLVLIFENTGRLGADELMSRVRAAAASRE